MEEENHEMKTEVKDENHEIEIGVKEKNPEVNQDEIYEIKTEVKEENHEMDIGVKEENHVMKTDVKEENHEIEIGVKEENHEVKQEENHKMNIEVEEEDNQEKYQDQEQDHRTLNTTNQTEPAASSGLQVNIPQAMPPPKKARRSAVPNQSKTRMVNIKAAVTAEMICPFPPPTSSKRRSATSIRAQMRQMQVEQIVYNWKLGSLQSSLQMQKGEIDSQKTMLEAQKVVIDSQTSELERLKTMLEEMSRRVSDLEQSHASKECCTKNGVLEGAANEDPVPQSPMANLSFQSLPASTCNLTLTSTPAQASPSRIAAPAQASPSRIAAPAQASPSRIATPAQASPSRLATPAQASPSRTSTPAQDSTPQDDSPATPTPVSTLADITLRKLSLDREETFYRNSFARGKHHPDVYAASVFMGLVPFQIYNSWVKKCNWAGTNGKMALPVNVKERVHSLVSQRFPNLTVGQWQQIRSRVNERLRFPRKVDPETPRPGYFQK